MFKMHYEGPGPHNNEALGNDRIGLLPEQLGFVETHELQQLRGDLVAAMMAEDTEVVKQLAKRYHQLGEQIVEQQTDDAYTRAQIGLLIAMGLIRRDGGRQQYFIEDLEDVLMYALNSGQADIVALVEEALSQNN